MSTFGKTCSSTLGLCALALVFLSVKSVSAQTCLTASDMGEAPRSALVNTAKRYFDMAARDDAGLRYRL